jgi:hypothetical protein
LWATSPMCGLSWASAMRSGGTGISDIEGS